jgi:transposase
MSFFIACAGYCGIIDITVKPAVTAMPKKRVTNGKLSALRNSRTLYAHADAVQDTEFRQNAFFDARDALQVKYEMLRRVSQEGASVSAAAKSFGLSRPAFYEARRAFQREGLAGLMRERPGPRRAHKLSAEVMACVDELLAAEKPQTLTKIIRIVQTRFAITVHRRSLERALARRAKKAR